MQERAKSHLHNIWQAETREAAETARRWWAAPDLLKAVAEALEAIDTPEAQAALAELDLNSPAGQGKESNRDNSAG